MSWQTAGRSSNNICHDNGARRSRERYRQIKVYGEPIDDADVGKIVDYLAGNY